MSDQGDKKGDAEAAEELVKDSMDTLVDEAGTVAFRLKDFELDQLRKLQIAQGERHISVVASMVFRFGLAACDKLREEGQLEGYLPPSSERSPSTDTEQ